MQAFNFHVPYGLGDTIVLSALLRDLELAYPRRFKICASGHFESYWRSFPWVHKANVLESPMLIDTFYQAGINASKSGLKKHFLTFFYSLFEQKTGIKVPIVYPRGEIIFREKPPLVSGRYWIVVAGGKVDMTTKWWLPSRYQEVVDKLRARGIHCVQAGVNTHKNSRSIHLPLEGVTQALDLTADIEDMFRLVAGAEGVICGITSFMHAAAALDKPCVVVAGGREEWWWEAYTNNGQFPDAQNPVKVPHRYLHTIGRLDCCQSVGCWRPRTVPIDQQDIGPQAARRLCLRPIKGKYEQVVPECLAMIDSDLVVEGVLSYYADGTLPPITNPTSVPVLNANPAPLKPIDLPKEKISSVETGLFSVMDHPYIKGKLTVFVLCFGQYTELARACIGSILESVPRNRLDLRVGLNAVCEATKNYIKSLGDAVTKVYDHPENCKKYPLMREMFYDESCPITTEYAVWFDDDTKVVDKSWCLRLVTKIIEAHPQGNRLYGTKMSHDLRRTPGAQPEHWFRSASWWKGADLRLSGKQQTAPNGSCIDFAVGYFWAIHVGTMRAAQIPDTRLNHNGGDITIGAQVAQAGYRICEFNIGKSLVWCPERNKGGRRGYSETLPWANR